MHTRLNIIIKFIYWQLFILYIITFSMYENLHKAYVKHLNYALYYQQLHLKYGLTWQGIGYKLPEDDTTMSKHVGV